MPKSVVTTEFVADQPVVVVIYHDAALADQIIQTLETEPIQVEAYTADALLQSSAIQQRLPDSYKILWVTDTADYLADFSEVEQVCQAIGTQQHKVSVAFSVISQFEEQVAGELPYASQFFKAQTDAILYLNQQLPAANFIFGQDIISSQLKTCFLHFLTQELPTNALIYSPRVRFYPQTVADFCSRLKRYFLQPQRASILLRGNAALGTALARDIKKLYQSYHFSPTDTQETSGENTATIPFSVVENFIASNTQSAVSHFVQAQPSPGSSQSAASWKKLLSNYSRSSAEYGTEVQQQPTPEEESQVVSEPEYEESKIEDSPLIEKINESEPQQEPQKGASAEEPAVSRLSSSQEESQVESTQEDSQANVKQTTNDQKQPFDLQQEIQTIFSENHVTHKKKQKSRISKTKKVVKKRTKKRTAVFYGGLAFTGMGLGVVFLAVFFTISLRLLRSSVTTFLESQLQVQAAEEAVSSEDQLQRITRLRKIVSVQADTYSFFLSLPAIDQAKQLSELSTDLTEVTSQTEKADQLAKTLYNEIVGLTDGNAVATAENLVTEALASYEKVSELESVLSSQSLPLQESSSIETAAEQYSQEVDRRRSGLQVLQQFSPLLSNLIGVEQKRTYALVLQNNQELRPTGGFIEAVALLTFQDGTLISSRVLRGDEIDQQLSGTVIPPEEITRYLNEEGWHFVDSNWNADFPEAAEQMAWFIDKSIGVLVDGVITIDLYGMANVLEKTGPLDMPQYNEVLTHKNVLDLFEFHSEISLVDTSSDYRTEVFTAFLEKITTLPSERSLGLALALRENFENHHMLLSFTNADELQMAKSLGWSGDLLQPGCPSQLESETCVVDTVAQVEANVGVNKANYYLKRSIENSIAITATQAAHTRKITFENTAQTESWPKGPYKSFIRLYLPVAAQAQAVSVNGQPLGGDEVLVQQVNNQTIIGFYVEVPVAQTKTATVSYTLPFSGVNNNFSYVYFDQKQPGSGPTPLTVTMQADPTLRPEVIAPQASFENNTATFTSDDLGHSFFGIKFTTPKN